MAARKPLKKDWIGFFNYSLSDQDRKAVNERAKTTKPGDVLDDIIRLTQDGYKVNFSYDVASGSTVCSVTGNHQSRNEGWTFSVKHQHGLKSLLAITHVVYEIFQGGQWPAEDYDSTNTDW